MRSEQAFATIMWLRPDLARAFREAEQLELGSANSGYGDNVSLLATDYGGIEGKTSTIIDDNHIAFMWGVVAVQTKVTSGTAVRVSASTRGRYTPEGTDNARETVSFTGGCAKVAQACTWSEIFDLECQLVPGYLSANSSHSGWFLLGPASTQTADNDRCDLGSGNGGGGSGDGSGSGTSDDALCRSAGWGCWDVYIDNQYDRTVCCSG